VAAKYLTSKPCTKCKEIKSLSEFRPRGASYRSACKPCEKKCHVKSRQQTRERRQVATKLIIGHVNLKAISRLFAQVSIDAAIQYKGTPCWTWTGCAFLNSGYGRSCVNGWADSVHRLIYAWLVGPLPLRVTGLKTDQLDHLCKNKLCCNPVHLELVPPSVNNMRADSASAKNAKKTHCRNGHLLSASNGFPSGGRTCKTCTLKRNKSNRHLYSDYFKAYSADPVNKERMRQNSQKHYLKRKAEKLQSNLSTS
jgi:hypothetical protein